MLCNSVAKVSRPRPPLVRNYQLFPLASHSFELDCITDSFLSAYYICIDINIIFAMFNAHRSFSNSFTLNIVTDHSYLHSHMDGIILSSVLTEHERRNSELERI
jgi:hypothetical protein